MVEKPDKLKEIKRLTAEQLDNIAWRILIKSTQYRDNELVTLFTEIQSFIDWVVFQN